MPHHHSDHSPLLLNYALQSNVVSRFRFQAMWVTHLGLRHLISNSWNFPLDSLYPMQLLGAKLKRLHFALKIWNRDSFDRLEANINSASLALQNIQS